MKYWIKRGIRTFGITAIASILGVGSQAQAGDPAALIQEKLASQIKLTKATSSHDDIVTAGVGSVERSVGNAESHAGGD